MYKFGYEVDNPSFRYLKYRILDNDEIEEVGESYYTNNLANAKQLFDEKLEEVCTGKGGKRNLDLLFKKMTEKMQFIEYVLNKGFDASVAFETMNNRGKKLTNLELLKNRLIYLTSLFDKEIATEGKKERITSLINLKWGIIYKWLGHDKGNHLDDDEFLRNHWILYFGYKRQTGTDYVDFLLKKKFIPSSVNGSFSTATVDEGAEDACYEDSQEDLDMGAVEETEKQQSMELLVPDDIENYVNDLASVSRLWYFTFHPESTECPFSSEEKNALLRLNRVGMAYFRPLVVAVFARNDITKDERLVLFDAIERVILLVFRMARQMSSYQNSVYYNLANGIIKGNTKVSVAIYRLNKLFVDDIVSSVKTFKAKMSAAFENDEGFYSWNSIRFLLFEYEASLCPKGDSSKLHWEDFVKYNKDMVTIEHIFPQNPIEGGWTQFDEFNKNDRRFFTNSLGNLLCLSQPKNSRLQNYSFDAKKKTVGEKSGYDRGSYSEMEVSRYDTWGPKEIVERGLKILRFIETRWLITFKNCNQMLDILGIPDSYRSKVAEMGLCKDEVPPEDKKKMLKERLLSGFEDVASEIGRESVSVDDLPPYCKIYAIKCDGKQYVNEDYITNILGIMEDLISKDPSKMDSICEVKEKGSWYPLFSRQEQKSKSFFDVCGVKVRIRYNRDLDLATLVKVAAIYGIKKTDIQILIRER